MVDPFTGLKDRIHEIKVDSDLIKVKPTVRDSQVFLTMSESLTEKDVEKLTTVIVRIIKNANPETDIGDIEAYVALHYMQVFQELIILFGFTTKEKLEAVKNKDKKKQEET